MALRGTTHSRGGEAVAETKWDWNAVPEHRKLPAPIAGLSGAKEVSY
jgi:hypothetical protein